MTQSPLPMTVIGGYLGAGKTSLINQLLQDPQGKRVMVMVNDFGAINIDAALLKSADEDTLTLTNGCVCCTMGADLFLAIGDVLDRSPRPDHLIIEASGIADPQKIANAALAEPELSYSGIVSLVDALNFPGLQNDPQIGPQIKAQVACADLVLLTKTDCIPPDLESDLNQLTKVQPLLSNNIRALAKLILQEPPLAPVADRTSVAAHPEYTRWSHQSPAPLSEAVLHRTLSNRPADLYRLKGFVQGENNTGWVINCVGQQVSILPIPHRTGTALVGIGLAGKLSVNACETWWKNARHNAAVLA